MVHALRGAQPFFHALFGVKTLSGALWGPVFNASGDGARFDEIRATIVTKAEKSSVEQARAHRGARGEDAAGSGLLGVLRGAALSDAGLLFLILCFYSKRSDGYTPQESVDFVFL